MSRELIQRKLVQIERRRRIEIRKAADQAAERVPKDKREAVRWILEAVIEDRTINMKRESERLEMTFRELYVLIGRALSLLNDELWGDI